MFCHYCGKQIKDNATFCSHCGKRLLNTTQKENNLETQQPVTSKTKPTQKKHHLFRNLLLCIIGLAIIIGTIYGLTYFGVINIPFLTSQTPKDSIEQINQEYNEITQNHLENLTGDWTVDVEKTNSSNTLSLHDTFGSGIRYGYEMILKEDGTASWYIGIGNGGEGTYSFPNNTGKLSYLDYQTETEKIVTLSILQESGKNYILMEYQDYMLYWIKKDDIETPVEKKISRKNYYNSDGMLVYYENYAYYDTKIKDVKLFFSIYIKCYYIT